MGLVSVPKGLHWPMNGFNLPINVANAVLDASGEKCAMFGMVQWADGGSHTINTSGSSKFLWRGGTTAVFDNASSVLEVGIQGVATSGPPAQPDGSFTVKAVVTTAADASPTLTTTNSWHSVTPTTGSATLAHGDLVAFVLDFSTVAGSDALHVQIGSYNATSYTLFPTTNAYASAAWGATGAGALPNCVFVASDGTLGTLYGSQLFGLPVVLSTWVATTNPDERGMIFRVPFSCKVGGFWCMMRTTDASSDFTLELTSSPESTRSSLASVTVDGAKLAATGLDRIMEIPLASEVSLTAGVDYCVSVRATGSSNIRFCYQTLGDAGYRAFFPGGTTMRGVTANDGSDFGSSSTVTMYPVGVVITQFQDGTGGGGGCRVIGG